MTILLVYTTIICKEEIYKLTFFTAFKISDFSSVQEDIDLHCQSFPLIPVKLSQNEGLRVRMIIFQESNEHCIRINV